MPVYNYIPYKITRNNLDYTVNWLDIEDRLFKEPFFDESIRLNRIHMLNRSPYNSVSDLSLIDTLSAAIDYINPTAFIFHVSRCGSTLLSQCLATEDTNAVIAEAPILDEILLLEEPINREQLFKNTVKLLGQCRLNQEKFFVKLDCWHINYYADLRKWFPDTPFYFLSREPIGIINSHKKRRGIQMVPGYLPAKSTGVLANENHYGDFNLFTADVLTRFYNALQDIYALNNPLDAFNDYQKDASGMLLHFNKHLNFQLQNIEPMMERLRFHSKYPDQTFNEDKPNWENFPYQNCLSAYLQLIKIYNENR